MEVEVTAEENVTVHAQQRLSAIRIEAAASAGVRCRKWRSSRDWTASLGRDSSLRYPNAESLPRLLHCLSYDWLNVLRGDPLSLWSRGDGQLGAYFRSHEGRGWRPGPDAGYQRESSASYNNRLVTRRRGAKFILFFSASLTSHDTKASKTHSQKSIQHVSLSDFSV
jgi:hypothetical protein